MYSGPEVEIHYRYSAILNVVFSTFTHGMALPILFPIAAFAMFNFYVCEKYFFAYFYRKPPLFDNKMNERALVMLAYAPVFLLAFGYWKLGNRQKFFNEVKSREVVGEVLDPQHYLFDYSDGPNNTIIYLIFIIFFIFHKYTGRFLQKMALFCKRYKKLDDFDDDWTYRKVFNEKLGCYWNCISGLD